ncbi:MAG: hypothetical protein Q9169_002303 [Polycauliona sp. 2 TL-2023]
MYLQANPGRGRTQEEQNELKSKYKPGERVLPRIRVGEIDAADERMLAEVREMSLRDAGVRSSDSYERGTRHRTGERRRDPSSDGRRGHQSSLRSLMSNSEIDSSEMEEEILRLVDEGWLDGIDLHNLDTSQVDELSERIADAYTRRHGHRTGSDNSASRHSNGHSAAHSRENVEGPQIQVKLKPLEREAMLDPSLPTPSNLTQHVVRSQGDQRQNETQQGLLYRPERQILVRHTLYGPGTLGSRDNHLQIRKKRRAGLMKSLILLLLPLMRVSFIPSRPPNAIGVTNRTYSMTFTGTVRDVKRASTIFALSATVLGKDAFTGMGSVMRRFKDTSETSRIHPSQEIQYVPITSLAIDTGARTQKWPCRRLRRTTGS